VIGGGTRTFVEMGDYTFEIPGEYTGRDMLGEASKKGAVFATKEEADASVAAIRELLADLGRWEQMTNVLRNIREGVETRGFTEPQLIRLRDLDFKVPTQLPTRPAPFRILFDLSREAGSTLGRDERPWLWEPENWIAAFKNLKRWKSLHESLQALRLVR